MTFRLWPSPAELFVGRTELGLLAVVLVWPWGGTWHHLKLRIA